MSGFELLINQERPIKIITTLLKNRTLPHALLFTGIAGVGKQAVALALAMACNCQGRPSGSNADDGSGQDPDLPQLPACGVCKSCKKIKAGNHPDIIRIQPSGPFIKIEQIRALLQTLSLKPYEARTRVVIISEAQSMNAAASNALLKILEEPPDRSMLVLLATRRSDLLPTIASRCQLVKFNRISDEYIASWVQKEHGLKPQEAKLLSETANGSLNRAQQLIAANWVLSRKWLLAEVQALSLQNIAHILALAEKLAREKELLNERFELIKTWFRDLIINRHVSHKMINQDMADQITSASCKTDMATLLSKMETIEDAQNRLTANTNVRLCMERLLMDLAK